MKIIMLTSEKYQEIYLTDNKHSVEAKIPLTKINGCFPLILLLKLSMKFYLIKIHNYFLSLKEKIKMRMRMKEKTNGN